MKITKKDRTHYRCEPDSELVEEVKRGVHVDWQELAIVLAERLEAANPDYTARYCAVCDTEV